jgi:hypothetical protein
MNIIDKYNNKERINMFIWMDHQIFLKNKHLHDHSIHALNHIS